MERSLLQQKDTLRAKTVAIKETMDAIKLLQSQRVGRASRIRSSAFQLPPKLSLYILIKRK